MKHATAKKRYFFSRNETVEEEPRLNDVLLERLLEQVWEDMQNKLQQEGSKVSKIVFCSCCL